MNTLQQPQPRKSTAEQNQNRIVTESAPINNIHYIKQQQAQSLVISQSTNNKSKKLHLNAQKFDIAVATPSQPQQQQEQPRQFPQQNQNQYQYNDDQYANQQQGYYNQVQYPQQQYQGQYNQQQVQYNQQPQQQYVPQQQMPSIPPPQQSTDLPKLTMKQKMSLKKALEVQGKPLVASEVMNDIALKVEDPKKKEEELQKKHLQEMAEQLTKAIQDKINRLKAQARSLLQISEISSSENVVPINSKISALIGREVKLLKSIGGNFSRTSNNQRNSTGTYNNKPQYNKQNTGRDSVVKKPIDDIQRGSNVIPSDKIVEKDGLQIRRYVEDPSVRLKKEELKKNLGWFESQDQTDEQKKLQKQLKFKLNQLAPDNKDIITKAIIEIIVTENKLADICAGQIMEKAWLEPRYRELYTQVCKVIVNDPRLQTESITDKQGKAKKRSIFKDAILNKVQSAFESDDILKKSEEELQKLSKSELEVQYIRRKNRILGNVRFIGDLFIQGVLPEQAIYGAQASLMSKFLTLRQSERPDSVLLFNPEDQLEGLVELYDKAGDALEKSQIKKRKTNLADELTAIEKIGKQLKAKQFDEINFDQSFSISAIFKLLRVLNQQLNLSKRINILIENLEDRKNNKWAEHYNHKNESAKTLDALQKEQDDLQDKQYEDDRRYRDNNRGGGRYSEKSKPQSQYQQKSKDSYYEKDQHQSYQEVPKKVEKEVQRGLQYAQDVEKVVKSSFDINMEEQLDQLVECFGEIKNDMKLQYAFWETFFSIILEAKLTNVQRADMLYQIYKAQIDQIDYECFADGLQKKFNNEDFVYDLIESKYGKELFVELFLPFFSHNESDFLEDNFKINLKNEDWKVFLKDVAQIIVQKSKEYLDPLIKFYQSSLDFSQQELDEIRT